MPPGEFLVKSCVKDDASHGRGCEVNPSIAKAILGFTLIELLVVAMLVAALGSLLLSALRGARQKAQQMQCVNNLRQLGTVLIEYANDHDDYVPDATVWYAILVNGKYIKWDLNALDAGNYSCVLICPSAITHKRAYGNYNDYGMEAWRFAGKKLSGFENPSRRLALLDCEYFYLTYFHANLYPEWLAPRHSGGFNLVFADGHCEWLAAPLPTDAYKFPWEWASP